MTDCLWWLILAPFLKYILTYLHIRTGISLLAIVLFFLGYIHLTNKIKERLQQKKEKPTINPSHKGRI